MTPSSPEPAAASARAAPHAAPVDLQGAIASAASGQQDALTRRHKTVTTLVLLALAALIAAFSMLSLGKTGSADLLAAWLAGDAVAQGHPALIYPADDTVFTMQPPVEWIARTRELGYAGEIFPYIYPPLWAWVMAPVARLMAPETLAVLAHGVNAALLFASLLIARRLCRKPPPLALWLMVGLLAYFGTNAGFLGLYQNQPQILVAFLTLLALERAQNGAPTLGGALLALAAALKLYPVLLAILWLARRQYRPFVAFVILGGTLAALSVAVAGWPLHQRFLELIRMITDSVLITSVNYTTDGLLAQSFWAHALTVVFEQSSDGLRGWLIMAKPASFAFTSRLLQLMALAALFWLGRRLSRRPEADPAAFWGAAMVILSLTSPLSWAYHYLAPLSFAALLPARYGRRGLALLVLILLPTEPHLSLVNFDALPSLVFGQVTGTLSMMLLAACLIWIALRPGTAPRT